MRLTLTQVVGLPGPLVLDARKLVRARLRSTVLVTLLRDRLATCAIGKEWVVRSPVVSLVLVLVLEVRGSFFRVFASFADLS